MKVNDIVELCKAGFTANQILQLVAAEQNAENTVQQPAQQPAQPDNNTFIDSAALNQINATLKSLTNAIHANNISISGAEYPREDNVDDIIRAAIINPPNMDIK